MTYYIETDHIEWLAALLFKW